MFTFFGLVTAYFFISGKIDSWITIKLLGFSGGCPVGFLRHEFAYTMLPIVLFLTASLVGFFSAIPLWGVTLILITVWYGAGKLGHADAYAQYRDILRSLLTVVESDTEKKDLMNRLAHTDKELHSQVMIASGIHVK